ncbi:MAG: hypothetical protein WA419_08315 [Silvibacterium sp.]
MNTAHRVGGARQQLSTSLCGGEVIDLIGFRLDKVNNSLYIMIHN